jgi:hypothetical protein
MLDISKTMDPTTINSLASNPWITVGGFVIGLLGVVLAVVFYVKAKKERVPCYEHSSNTLIEGVDKTLDGLQLHYRGQPQSRITVTKVVFWNEGRETIDKSDLVIADPVRILCPLSVDILDIQIVQSSSSANAVRLGLPSSSGKHTSYPIEFEYLDHKDYFVIQIVHNGDDTPRFNIIGKIKGVSELVRVPNARVKSKALRLIPIMSQLERLMDNRLFMKYAGTGSYLALACVGAWLLTHGKNDWYVWAGTTFCAFAASIMYISLRRTAPVNI